MPSFFFFFKREVREGLLESKNKKKQKKNKNNLARSGSPRGDDNKVSKIDQIGII